MSTIERLAKHLLRFSTLAGLAVVAGLGSINAALAQQLLGYGRGTCQGQVTVDNTAREPKLEIKSHANGTAQVSSRTIVWRCDNQQQSFDCPPSTNIVQIDRRQGPGPFSIICMRR